MHGHVARLLDPVDLSWDMTSPGDPRLLIVERSRCSILSYSPLTGNVARLTKAEQCVQMAPFTSVPAGLADVTPFQPGAAVMDPRSGVLFWAELGADGRVVACCPGSKVVGVTGAAAGHVSAPRTRPPVHISLDADRGLLYLTVPTYHTVYRIGVGDVLGRPGNRPGAEVDTVAIGSGTSAEGNSGDGGAATIALISSPAATAAKRDGSVMLLEDGASFPRRIRFVARDGTALTLAGGNASATIPPVLSTPIAANTFQFSGLQRIALDERREQAAVTDGRRVLLLSCPAPLAAVEPTGAGLCGGNYGSAVATGFLSVLAGNASVDAYGGDGLTPDAATMRQPVAIAYNNGNPAANSFFFSDTTTFTVRGVVGGLVTPLLGAANAFGEAVRATTNGTSYGTSSLLQKPASVAVDGNTQTVVTADQSAHSLIAVDLATGLSRIVAGLPPAAGSCPDGEASGSNICGISVPRALAIDAVTGTILFVEQSLPAFRSSRIRAIAPNDRVFTIAGCCDDAFIGPASAPVPVDGGPATPANFTAAVTALEWVQQTRVLLVADTDGNAVWAVAVLPPPAPTWPATGSGSLKHIAGFAGMAVPPAGGAVASSSEGVLATQYDLIGPVGLAYAPSSGSIFVTTRRHTVLEIRADGRVWTVLGSGTAIVTPIGSQMPNPPLSSATSLSHPRSPAWDAASNLLAIPEADGHRILAAVCYRKPAPSAALAPACSLAPFSQFAVKAALNAAHTPLAVGQADYAANPMPGELRPALAPKAAAVDPVTGTVYVSDSAAAAVYALEPDGSSRVFAGQPLVQSTTDGDGAPTFIRMGAVWGLAWDPGNSTTWGTDGGAAAVAQSSARLLIADSTACVIRARSFAPPQLTVLLGQPGDCGQAPHISPAGTATLQRPTGLAFHAGSGTLVWTEPTAARVMAAVGGTVFELATGASGLQQPLGVAVDAVVCRCVYVADRLANSIMRFPLPGSSLRGLPTVVAGTGVAGYGAGQLFGPQSVVLGPSGALLVSEEGGADGGRIRVLYPRSRTVTLSVVMRETRLPPLAQLRAALPPEPAYPALVPPGMPSQDVPSSSSPPAAGGAEPDPQSGWYLYVPKMLGASPFRRSIAVPHGHGLLAGACVPTAPPAGTGTCAGTGGQLQLVAGSPLVADPSGDGLQATSPQVGFGSVSGIAVGTSASSNIFISDAAAREIRMISGSSGIISTIAGNASFDKPFLPCVGACNDVAASRVQLTGPTGLCLDGINNRLIVADETVLRAVDLQSMQAHVVAGTGAMPEGCFDGTSADMCPLWHLSECVVDELGGRIIFAESNMGSQVGRVRAIESTGLLVTLAGPPNELQSGFFSSPPVHGASATGSDFGVVSGVAFDSRTGTLYLVDATAGAVWGVSPGSPSRLLHVAGGAGSAGLGLDGSSAVLSDLYSPAGLAFSPASRSLYFATAAGVGQFASLVREVTADGKIYTVAGRPGVSLDVESLPAMLPSARLAAPAAVALHEASNSLLIVESAAHRVSRAQCRLAVPRSTVPLNASLCPAPLPSTAAYSGAGVISTTAQASPVSTRAWTFVNVRGAAANRTTDVLVPPLQPAASRALSQLGTMAVDPYDGSLFVSDVGMSAVLKVSRDGSNSSVFAGTPFQPGISANGAGGPATGVSFSQPFGLAMDHVGRRLFVGDQGTCRIWSIGLDGLISSVFVGSPAVDCDISRNGTDAASMPSILRPREMVWHHRLRMLIWIEVETLVNGLPTPASRHRIMGVRDGLLWALADSAPSGGFTGLRGQLWTPSGLVVDAGEEEAGSDVFVYVVDSSLNVLVGIGLLPNSPAVLAVGLGTEGYSGDGGPLAQVQLSRPSSFARLPGGYTAVLEEAQASGMSSRTTPFKAKTRYIRILSRSAPFAQSLVLPDGNSSSLAADLATGTLYVGAGSRIYAIACVAPGASNLNASMPVPAAISPPEGWGLCSGGDGPVSLVMGKPGGTANGTGTASSNGDGGAAALASLAAPTLIAFDSTRGFAYVLDAAAGQLRAISADGTAATVTAFQPKQRNITCLTIAGARGLLFADAAAPALLTYLPSALTGQTAQQVQVLVVGTPPLAGQCSDATPPLRCAISQPSACAYDEASDRIFFAEYGPHPRLGLVRAIRADRTLNTWTDTIPDRITALHWHAASTDLYVSAGGSVYRIQAGHGAMHIPVVVIGAGPHPPIVGQLAIAASLQRSVALLHTGSSLLVGEASLQRLLELRPNGRLYPALGGDGSNASAVLPAAAAAAVGLVQLQAAAYSVADNALLVADAGAARVMRVQCTATDPEQRACALPDAPLVTRANRNYEVGGFALGDDVDGATSYLPVPSASALDRSTGDVYIAFSADSTIRVLRRSDGRLLRVAGITGNTTSFASDGPARLRSIGMQQWGLAFDAVERRLLVAARYSHALLAVHLPGTGNYANGWISRIAGTGVRPSIPSPDGLLAMEANISNPYDLALNPCSRDVFFVEVISGTPATVAVRVVRASTGRLETVAGSLLAGQGSSGSFPMLSTVAFLSSVTSLAFSASDGVLYISEAAGRVRALLPPTPPATTSQLVTVVGDNQAYGFPTSALMPAWDTVAPGQLPARAVRFPGITRFVAADASSVGSAPFSFSSSSSSRFALLLSPPSARPAVIEFTRNGSWHVLMGNASGSANETTNNADELARRAVLSGVGALEYDDRRGELIVVNANRFRVQAVTCPAAAANAPPQPLAVRCAALQPLAGMCNLDGRDPIAGLAAPLLRQTLVSSGFGAPSFDPPSDTEPTFAANIGRPYGIVWDPDTDAVFFTTPDDHLIRAVIPYNATTGEPAAVVRIAGVFQQAGYNSNSGLALLAAIGEPHGLALDIARRRLFVASKAHHAVYAVSVPVEGAPGTGSGPLRGGEISVLAGLPPLSSSTVLIDGSDATTVLLHSPVSLAWDPLNRTLYIGSAAGVVWAIRSSLTPAAAAALTPYASTPEGFRTSTLAGLGSSPLRTTPTPARSLKLGYVGGLAWRPWDGSLLVVDTADSAVGVIYSNGSAALFAGSRRPLWDTRLNGAAAAGAFGLPYPRGIAAFGDSVWVAAGVTALAEVTGKGKAIILDADPPGFGMEFPQDTLPLRASGLAFRVSSGSLLIADYEGGEIAELPCAGVAQPSPSASPAPSASPPALPTASPSASPGSLAALSVAMDIAFNGSLHASHAHGSTAAPAVSAGSRIPATVIARGWAPPVLAVKLRLTGSACVPAPAVELRCGVNTTAGRVFALYPNGSAVVGAEAGAVDEAAVAVAPQVVRMLRPASTSCFSLPSSFSLVLYDNRSSTSGAVAGSGFGGGSAPAKCGASSPASSPAAFLSVPLAEMLLLGCRLRVASSVDADQTLGSPFTVLAEAQASVLLLSPALPVLSDVLPVLPSAQSAGPTAPTLSLATAVSARTGAISSIELPVAVANRSSALAVSLLADSDDVAEAVASAVARSSSSSSSSFSSADITMGRAVQAPPPITAGSLLALSLSPHQSQWPSVAILRAQSARAAARLQSGNASAESCRAAAAIAAAEAAAVFAAQRGAGLPARRLVVFIGTAPANITWISADGTFALIRTPSLARICGSRRAECGYQSLTVRYVDEPNAFNVSRFVGGQASSSSDRRRQLQRSGAAVDWSWLTTWIGGSSAPDVSNAITLLRVEAAAGRLPPTPPVACPPFCPHTASAAALPFGVPASMLPLPIPAAAAQLPAPDEPWMGVVAPALPLRDASTGELLEISALASANAALAASQPLLYLTAKCTAAAGPSGPYTDWASGACSNASDPASARCAFGAGDDCRPCPTLPGSSTPAGLCPGGYRFWPAPGVWSPSESTATAYRCKPPSSRCAGWSTAAGGVACARGYAPLSAGCLACAPGYAVAMDGSCAPCPQQTALSPLLRAFLLFAGIAAGCIAVIMALALAVAWLVKAPLRSNIGRALDLAAWVLAILQTLAQAGRSVSPGLPEPVLALFQALAATSLEDPSFPPACAGPGYAFRNQVVIMGCGIGLLLLLAVALLLAPRIDAWCSSERQRSSKLSAARGAAGKKLGSHVKGRAAHASLPRSLLIYLAVACLYSLGFLYAPVVNAAFSSLSCTTTRVSLLAYAALDGAEPAVAAAAVASAADDAASDQVTTIGVLLLNANPSFICFAGSHEAVGGLAVAASVLIAVCFPLAAALWARRRIAILAAADLQLAAADERETSKKSQPRQASVCSAAPAGSLAAALLDTDEAAVAAQHRSRGLRSRCAAFWCGREWLLLRAVHRSRATGSAHPIAAAAADSQRSSAALIVQQRSTDAAHAAVAGLLWSQARNQCRAATKDALLSPLVGSAARPSTFDSKTANSLLTIGAVAAVQQLWKRPEAAAEAASRGIVTVLLLLCAAWIIGTRSPYWPVDGWKRVTHVGTLVLAALAAIVTHVSLAVDLAYGSPPDAALVAADPSGYDRASTARLGLSYVLLIGVAALLLLLAVSFAAAVLRDARRDASEARQLAAQGIDEATAEARARAVARASFLQFASVAAPSISPLVASQPCSSSALVVGAGGAVARGSRASSSASAFGAENPLLVRAEERPLAGGLTPGQRMQQARRLSASADVDTKSAHTGPVERRMAAATVRRTSGFDSAARSQAAFRPSAVPSGRIRGMRSTTRRSSSSTTSGQLSLPPSARSSLRLESQASGRGGFASSARSSLSPSARSSIASAGARASFASTRRGSSVGSSADGPHATSPSSRAGTGTGRRMSQRGSLSPGRRFSAAVAFATAAIAAASGRDDDHDDHHDDDDYDDGCAGTSPLRTRTKVAPLPTPIAALGPSPPPTLLAAGRHAAAPASASAVDLDPVVIPNPHHQHCRGGDQAHGCRASAATAMPSASPQAGSDSGPPA